ncbi:hypothetical protein GCM10009741_74110 [Kribbella lupini]|uniref:Type VII secretion system protein EssD-like domain-containing protein n=2 Tax=Kribbella lupini TaxID=291602 RepID=A0ABN2CL79_9ACTN
MSAQPSAHTAALQLDQAARSCEEAAHLASIAPQRARAWAEQLILSEGSLPVRDPLPADRNPTAGRPRPGDNADQKTVKLDIGRPEIEPHIDGPGSDGVKSDDVLKLSTTNRDHRPTLDAPPPNSSILVDEKFLYRTDHDGRVISAHAVLDRIDLQHPRDTAAQRRLAGKLTGDHAGHIFARIFGGPIGTMNLVPMKGSKVNLSQYKVIENHWRRLIDRGEAIDVSVRFSYDDDAVRPHKIRVRYEHADGIVRRTIDNSPHRGAK